MRKDFLVRKLLGRRVCPECNVSYNVAHIEEDSFFMPAVMPVDPSCQRCYNRIEDLERRQVG